MEIRTKYTAITLLTVALVSLSSITLWLVTRVSIPPDVRGMLDTRLTEEIESGTIHTIHDCIVLCESYDGRDRVIATLPNSSVGLTWDIISAFQAYLTVDEIFRLAPMAEVTRIESNAEVSIDRIPTK